MVLVLNCAKVRTGHERSELNNTATQKLTLKNKSSDYLQKLKVVAGGTMRDRPGVPGVAGQKCRAT